jgi:signal transduction histidine kinase
VREVSCRAVEPFFRAADERRIRRSELVAGLVYSQKHLENRHEYIEWDAFRRFMANVRRFFSEADLVEIGARGLDSPGFRSFALIGRTLMSPSGFYRWMLTSGGMGNQLFSNMIPRFEEVGPGHFRVDLRLAPGYEPCPEFFLFAGGGFKGIPALVGLDQAVVEQVDLDRGARFDIRFRDKPSLRGRWFKLLGKVTDARQAATELDDAIKTLEQRYSELEQARFAVERQRHTLDTAYRVAHHVWGERDAAEVSVGVVKALVDVGGFAGARVTSAGGEESAQQVAHGAADAGETLSVSLTGHHIAGKLEVWLAPAADAAEARTLLDLVAPTVALAIDNAFAYRELASYQRGLERLVDERTVELRQARDELSDTVRQLQDAQEARERIFANISHEIRTPLSLILLAVADVEARAGEHLDEMATADLTSVVESARKLLRLVDELLLLAAGRERGLQITPEAFDVSKLVSAIVATWRPAADAAGLVLSCEVPDNLHAMIDPVALERVMTNLLSNAVKFTPRGGRIALDLSRQADSIQLAVRDTGVGIDDDLLRRLFGRFEQGRGAANIRGGSGIGLSLVKELVEAHGGRVDVERVRSGGTEFRVTLPALEPGTPVTGHAAPRLRPTDYGLASAVVRSGDILTPARRAAATILVAEDDPKLAAAVAHLLAEEHRVIVALDGLAALDLARQHSPHLLITDVEMPGMDGIELTRRFRDVVGNKLAPVLILSALADPGDRLAGLDAGAVDYVVKPFDPRELKARVRSQLRMRDLALRLHRAEQLAALGTLSSGLAHELRNPANGIVNAVAPLRELLPADQLGEDAPVGQLLEVLEGCAEQIAFLSRQLLGFKRGGELELRTIGLDEIVERSLTLSRPALRGIELRERLAATPIRCAPPLLVQVMTNLLENAGHAAGTGGWVEIASHTRNGRVIVEVADSGPGVPAELRERVFEPFFTTKPPGVGTGLGLPLSRDIVHRHGGLLEIRERDGRTIFTVELPDPLAGAPSQALTAPAAEAS